MIKGPRILMCPPDYYGIDYEINAWMDRSRQADGDLATQQWRNLRSLLEASGATIELLEPVAGLPDMVFTANAGLVHYNDIVLSRFRPEQRRGEEEYDRAWFEGNGFQVLTLPEDRYFEGAGDALFCGDTLFAGYRMRSDALAQQQLGALLDCHVIPMELVDPYYYHLDTCFCPLAPGVAMYYPHAFDDYGQRVLRETVDCLIEINGEEAARFAGNAVVVGTTVVTNVGCPDLHAQLKNHGFQLKETDLSEFVKAGGSAKCLTLRLDGEEAAGWRAETPRSSAPTRD